MTNCAKGKDLYFCISAVADLYFRAVEFGLSTDHIVPRVHQIHVPMSIRCGFVS